MNNSCLILLAHGSKNPDWSTPFRKLTADLRKDLGNDAVYLCFLENSEPTLMEVAPEIMKTSVRKARMLPLFMAKVAHFHEDIPDQIAAIASLTPCGAWGWIPPSHTGIRTSFRVASVSVSVLRARSCSILH